MWRLPVIAVFGLAAAVAGAQIATDTGTGVTVRALDKLTGQVSDVEIPARQSQRVGRIEITAHECRYPQGNAAGEAYASITVRENGDDLPAFEGWMIASSPALNAMDHPRYDVWVLRCTTS
ncbi:DUF2155 domain-containing protein [Marivita sp. GX14005]|uniref:DUF2155 domain-containing protein n=1 Tax=Marivita sp. GX14005 TaxID=2942276 RepID=UPI0020187721|nr:DUF2155 domain-containing protein [Marivita sp. GX14005]MCL3880812.1 DUF2155 domain-containing protein [Marivita sp. GX14005]